MKVGIRFGFLIAVGIMILSFILSMIVSRSLVGALYPPIGACNFDAGAGSLNLCDNQQSLFSIYLSGVLATFSTILLRKYKLKIGSWKEYVLGITYLWVIVPTNFYVLLLILFVNGFFPMFLADPQGDITPSILLQLLCNIILFITLAITFRSKATASKGAA